MTYLRWNDGTAYDFFISQLVLHHSADFGLRPAWAAGVRQRLSPPRREFLERLHSYATLPLNWIATLPSPGNAGDALRALAGLDPAERLPAAALPDDLPADTFAALDEARRRGAWTAEHKERIGRGLEPRNRFLRSAGLDRLLEDWVAPDRRGDELLAALEEYYRAFFEDEETRLRPALSAGLQRARELAAGLPLAELVEELSRGVRIAELEQAVELTLAASYWSSPFIFASKPGSARPVIVFGCRPEVESVAPGAQATDSLVTALKSLGDPTRLRILRYLSDLPQTPSELARRLRLRPPTVVHHLQVLRLSGLVAVHIGEDVERRYAPRLETLTGIFTALEAFIEKQD